MGGREDFLRGPGERGISDTEETFACTKRPYIETTPTLTGGQLGQSGGCLSQPVSLATQRRGQQPSLPHPVVPSVTLHHMTTIVCFVLLYEQWVWQWAWLVC